MSVRMLYGEPTIRIPIDLTDYLAAVGILPADITAAIFIIKQDKTLSDSASGVYSATLANGYLTNVGVLFHARISSFTGLLPETKYYIGFGIKISGDTTYREVPLKEETNTLYFTGDVIRG